MKREDFVKVAEDALDSLPEEFRSRIHNVAILVEDFPPNQSPPRPGHQVRLLLGVFHGVPATKKSFFDVPVGPAHIVLYQKNIEAVCPRKGSAPSNSPNADARTRALLWHV
jgi:predicted Zn-dependent protease with MMP-like domain